MQEAIFASLFHIATSESEDDHWRYCSKSTSSWCQYHCDSKWNKFVYTGPGISSDVANAI